MNNFKAGQVIEGASAWRGDTFKSTADFTVQLPQAVLDVLPSILARKDFDQLRYDQIDLERFGCDAIERFIEEQVRPQIYGGRGFVLIDGIDTSRYSVAQMEKLYWIFGLYLGEPLSQSAAGDFLGHVEDRTPAGAKESARGYTGRRILPLHTDGGDVMGLMCIRPARSGGTTVMSSIHTVYNDLLANEPHLLPTLFKGYHYHRRGEQAEGSPMITPYRVPVLHDVDGMLSSHYVRSSIEVAARDLGAPLAGEELAALDAFDRHANSERNRIEFDLRPGQMLMANNYTTMHARTEFEDHDGKDKKRLMLRLWLVSQPRWNVPSQLFVYENKSGRPGVDPKPGGSPASADYLHRYASDTAAMAHEKVISKRDKSSAAA